MFHIVHSFLSCVVENYVDSQTDVYVNKFWNRKPFSVVWSVFIYFKVNSQIDFKV